MAKLNRRVIQLADIHDDMVDRIRDEKGFISNGDVHRAALMHFHQHFFPAYAERKKKKETEPKVIDIDAIASKLGVEIYLIDKIKYARYFTYSGKKRYLQEFPLKDLTPDMVTNQYQPSRAIVDAFQQSGKCDY